MATPISQIRIPIDIKEAANSPQVRKFHEASSLSELVRKLLIKAIRQAGYPDIGNESQEQETGPSGTWANVEFEEAGGDA